MSHRNGSQQEECDITFDIRPQLFQSRSASGEFGASGVTSSIAGAVRVSTDGWVSAQTSRYRQCRSRISGLRSQYQRELTTATLNELGRVAYQSLLQSGRRGCPTETGRLRRSLRPSVRRQGDSLRLQLASDRRYARYNADFTGAAVQAAVSGVESAVSAAVYLASRRIT